MQIESAEWDEKSDIWSVACILVELYSGEPLFNARCDSEHEAMIEKVVGSFPKWMPIKNGIKYQKKVKRTLTLNARLHMTDRK